MNRIFAAVDTVAAPERPSGPGINDLPDPAEPPAIAVTEAVTGIYRVALGTATVGYVQHTGGRYVSLLGPVYNTSIEVAQTLALDTAVRRLLLA